MAIDPRFYVNAADDIATGRVPLLLSQFCQLGDPPDWNSSPLVEASSLDGREGSEPLLAARAGDIKYLWELNRHLHFVTLAQAWYLRQKPKHLETLRNHLESWLAQCPYPDGPNWLSAMEAAMRLINWSIAWQLLGGQGSPLFQDDDGKALLRKWLASIYLHARYIDRNVSRFSSANNHLIGELTGIIVARATWPYWKSLDVAADAATVELTRQALLQNTVDGVNREQATSYHVFVFDLLAIAFLAARQTEAPLGDEVLQRLGAMARFSAAMRDSGGNVPAFGDSDDAVAALLDGPAKRSGVDAVIAVAVALNAAPELASLQLEHHDCLSWLLGLEGEVPSEGKARDMRSRQTLPRAFPEGGYYVLGSDLGNSDEVIVIADGGGLGYLDIAAHGHADALSVTMSVKGTPILIDPGTFSYNVALEWREASRRTLGHNTLCVDGLSQSEAGGPFLWLRKAKTTTERFSSDEKRGEYVGWHDGYHRLADPVTHHRHVSWSGERRILSIDDVVECRRRHSIAAAWHFSSGCELAASGPKLVASAPGVNIEMTVSMKTARAKLVGGRWRIFIGDERSRLGWHFPEFGRRRPSPTALWTCEVDRTTSIETRFDLGSKVRVPSTAPPDLVTQV